MQQKKEKSIIGAAAAASQAAKDDIITPAHQDQAQINGLLKQSGSLTFFIAAQGGNLEMIAELAKLAKAAAAVEGDRALSSDNNALGTKAKK